MSCPRFWLLPLIAVPLGVSCAQLTGLDELETDESATAIGNSDSQTTDLAQPATGGVQSEPGETQGSASNSNTSRAQTSTQTVADGTIDQVSSMSDDNSGPTGDATSSSGEAATGSAEENGSAATGNGSAPNDGTDSGTDNPDYSTGDEDSPADTTEEPPTVPNLSSLSVGSTTTDLNEDLSDGDRLVSPGGFQRTWSTSSDGTANITPAPYTPITPTDGTIVASGTGFNDWGAALVLNFDNGRITDLRAYQGIELTLRGSGDISLIVLTNNIRSEQLGGGCVGLECEGHYYVDLQLTEQPQTYRIAFSSLVRPDWAQPLNLDLSQVISIDFSSQVEISGSASIDLTVESFRFDSGTR